MIDPTKEPLVSLKAAARHPGLRAEGAKPPHVNAVYRWISHGVQAQDGTQVRLESFRTPLGLCTSKEAIERFLARLNSSSSNAPVSIDSPRRQRDIDQAERELAEHGIR